VPLHAPRRTSVTAEVITQLEAMISSGEWPVGAKIPPEPELVAGLGVGRNSVREAVRALIHTGLLEARQGDGTYVRANTGLGAALERHTREADALHVLEIRRGLEREAARLAATRRGDDDLAALEAAMAAQRAAAAAQDRDAFVRADVAFHHAVATAAHNPVLADLLDHLGASLDAAIDVAVEHLTLDSAFAVHTELAEAVRAGRPEEAATAADALVERSLAVVRAGGGQA
jgi:DNA-binding FadR family transcriptional regulator